MTHIHGYTMGHVGAATAAAAVSGAELSQLRASVLFGDDDRAALRRAGELLDEFSTRRITDALSAEASVAVAEAKILTTEIALEAAEKLFDLAGSSATRAGHNLDRHWRNARVHTLHDPVRWKYHLLGNYALNGTFPTRHQWN